LRHFTCHAPGDARKKSPRRRQKWCKTLRSRKGNFLRTQKKERNQLIKLQKTAKPSDGAQKFALRLIPRGVVRRYPIQSITKYVVSFAISLAPLNSMERIYPESVQIIAERVGGYLSDRGSEMKIQPFNTSSEGVGDMWTGFVLI
jgi:hypothetical protein